MYDYAADDSVSMNELKFLSRQLQAEADVTGQWFSDNAMEAKLAKCHGSLLKDNKQAKDFEVSVQGEGIEFSKSITGPGIYVDENLTFDEIFSNISDKY